MAGKYMKIIRKTIPTFTMVLIASQLFGCSIGTKDQIAQMLKDGQSITIEYAEGIEQEAVKNCEDSEWKALNDYTDNLNFRQLYELKTSNKTTQAGEKQGTIYTQENPTLKTALTNTAFISYINSITADEYSSILKDVYVDTSSITSQEALKRVAINKYFNLFSSKENNNTAYNVEEKVSRIDFMSALTKAVTPYTDNPNINQSFVNAYADSDNIDCVEIASMIADKSFIGTQADKVNYTENGKITKIEAIYLAVHSLYSDEEINKASSVKLKTVENAGSIAEKQGYNKVENVTKSKLNSAVLSYCLSDSKHNKLDEQLYKVLAKAVQDGIVKEDVDWYNTMNKDEAIELIYNTITASTKQTTINVDPVKAELEADKQTVIASMSTNGLMSEEEISKYTIELGKATTYDTYKDIVADIDSIQEAKLEEIKEQAEQEITELGHINIDEYVQELENRTTAEEVTSLIAEAKAEDEAEAQRQAEEQARIEAERARQQAIAEEQARQQAVASSSRTRMSVTVDGGGSSSSGSGSSSSSSSGSSSSGGSSSTKINGSNGIAWGEDIGNDLSGYDAGGLNLK